MTAWIAFWSILRKDMTTYYLKPPNISWGIIFPVAWTLAFFMRSSTPVDVRSILPGVMIMSVLFGTTSMLSVTITFERRSASFNRLLLAPISLTLLILAKTSGAILFGVANAFVPMLFALFVTNLGGIHWGTLFAAVLFTAVTSTLLALFIAVSVSEVFEAQTFSNFFRFPMIFLCGLFVPLGDLPWYVRPLSFILPPTYGVDLARSAITGSGSIPFGVSLSVLSAMTALLFAGSLANVKRRWVL
ncbi:MAG: ABC transporter permease [Firmicutes bacterium]|jgi:ABC-2 type transport system permease protein|nr:ABC transporter permease [Bacillota bacterium]